MADHGAAVNCNCDVQGYGQSECWQPRFAVGQTNWQVAPAAEKCANAFQIISEFGLPCNALGNVPAGSYTKAIGDASSQLLLVNV